MEPNNNNNTTSASTNFNGKRPNESETEFIERLRRQAQEKRRRICESRKQEQQGNLGVPRSSGLGDPVIRVTQNNIPNNNNNTPKIVSSYSTTLEQVKLDASKPLVILFKINVALKSSDTFAITCQYQSDITSVFRRIQGMQFDLKTKEWTFPIAIYRELMRQLKELNSVKIEINDPLPEQVIDALVKANEKYAGEVDLTERLTPEFIESLFPFQKEGITFAVKRGGRCLIADDMGLGKTVQAIALALWFREDWPLIIITPSSLRFQWREAIFRWVPNLKDEDVFMAENIKDLFPKRPISIVTYDIIARMNERFLKEEYLFYNMIILDESHYIKTDSSMRTEGVSLLAQSCKRVVLLSGTPALSRPMELYPQLHLLEPKLFSSKHQFGLRYCDAKLKTIYTKHRPVNIWKYTGATNLEELRILLETTVMIRRLKTAVLKDMPTKRREVILLDLKEPGFLELDIIETIKENFAKSNGSSMLTVFKLSAELKAPVVADYVLEACKSGTKLLCFCHHLQVMNCIENMLHENKISHIRIDGSTPPRERAEACRLFQEQPQFKVALLSITACATGLNLTAAKLVIFAEAYWNPGVLVQAEDRCYRIGQKDDVKITYLVVRKTIDEKIWPLIERKLNILSKVGLSGENFDMHNPLNVSEDQALITEFLQTVKKE